MTYTVAQCDQCDLVKGSDYGLPKGWRSQADGRTLCPRCLEKDDVVDSSVKEGTK